MMTQELKQKNLDTLLDHHNLQTASPLKELQQRSGLKAPFILPHIPLYQVFALLIALFAFPAAFLRPSILPFAGMPSGDLAYLAVIAISFHVLKRSTASGLAAFGLVVINSFLNPLSSVALLIAAAVLFIYGMITGFFNQARIDSFRTQALKRIMYREERQKKWQQEEDKRQLQKAHFEELVRQNEALQVREEDELDLELEDNMDALFDLGPLQPYEETNNYTN